MARVEATVPTMQAEQLDSLAEELEMTKGQLVQEALAFYMKAVAETKLGRRVAIVDPATEQTIYAITSPVLSMVEWPMQQLAVSTDEANTIGNMIKSPAAPTATLRRAMSRRRK